MPYSIHIYIGSDNGSKKICRSYLQKVRQWANASFPNGYTLMRAKGYYNGIPEDSLLVNVLSDSDVSIRQQVQSLKRELSQEAILVVKSQVNFELV